MKLRHKIWTIFLTIMVFWIKSNPISILPLCQLCHTAMLLSTIGEIALASCGPPNDFQIRPLSRCFSNDLLQQRAPLRQARFRSAPYLPASNKDGETGPHINKA